jgi:hypothetical protein
LTAWPAAFIWLIVLSHGVVAATCRSYNEWKRDKEGTSSATAGSSGSSTAAGDAARGLGQEAKDTAQSAKEVVKMEGQAAGGDKVLTASAEGGRHGMCMGQLWALVECGQARSYDQHWDGKIKVFNKDRRWVTDR